MAKSVDKITLLLDLKGFKSVKGLGQDFNKFKSTVKLSAREVDKVVKGLTKFHGNTKLSTNALRGQISALTRLKDNVGINTKAYKQLSVALEQAKNKMNQLTSASKKQERFAFLGKGGRAALGGAIGRFLPSSAQIGGIAGFADSGFKGAVKGAGIGLAVDAVAGGVQFAKQAAIQASQVQKLEIALRGAVKTEADFKKGLEIIANTSKRLNVPIAASTKQFTTLAASVVGAGGSIEDAQVVFEGVSNSIKATGGNAEDVQSAIRAMSQIFGKGKVSAEELQGQLGERLAGAVVKFAEANGSSLQKLQKDLRDGTVGLDQVIKFAQKLNIDFAETAERVANSSADAGQRLQTQIQNLSITIGRDLIPIGAALQKQFSEMLLGFQGNEGAVVALTETIKVFGGFLVSTVALARTLVRILVDMVDIINNIAVGRIDKAFLIAQKGFKDFQTNLDKDMALLNSIRIGGQPPKAGEGSGANTTTEGLPSLTEDQSKKAQSILDKYAESVRDVNTQIANSFVNTFKKLEDSLVEFVQTGTLNFKKLARSIISDITRIFIRSKIISPLLGGFGNLFGGGGSKTIRGVSTGSGLNALDFDDPNANFAKGAAFASNQIIPYAKGGIVNKPKIFGFSRGIGLMGEAGPEAILPLQRGRGGKLGVIAQGGGTTNVVVNVDASGSSVEGDEQQGRELGRLISAAIQSELIEQQRPGGLLS
tara:strand:- start:6888 stop:9014 length:2127 start_codon:yes stop_codon:yes gene_type:complete